MNLESYVMHLIHISKPGRNPARESRCIFAFNAKNRECMRFFQILHVSRLCIHNFCCLLNSRFLRISSVFSHGNYASIQFSFNLSASIRNGCVMTPRKRREAERNEHSSPIETMKNYANKSRPVMTARQTSVASLIAVLIAGCP